MYIGLYKTPNNALSCLVYIKVTGVLPRWPLWRGSTVLFPFYLLAKVANWSQVSLHCWKSGIWRSLIIWLVTKYHWAYFHLQSTLFLRTPRFNGKPTIRTTANSRVSNNLQAFDWNKIRTLANENTNQTNSRFLGCPL